ncbi:copper resistance protein CopC [Nocardioides sp. zg-1228]|uniref:copper resistance CopC/CopD family protein n=1 Tax=Nocardioides sp. zg-1228 TaxID=2763008 RepID=UPI0016434951|nr:copper resistance protein CopC [Nocardioides sp. zg-1228]MBC2933828.1 copper resistance protein CopC [Nocardioides sp. zg-1228]QSF58600.1 copper resistance protein CopC [Nocardioides sp. zg-1228]
MGAVLVALALVVLGAAPASAHAELVDSDPAEGAVVETAPEVVTLTFNEPVRLTAQEIAVYDAAGEPVEATAGASGTEVTVELPGAADLADGSYVVSWNVLSGDGHPVAGALTFSVGAPSASVSAPPEAETSSAAVTVLRDVLSIVTLVGLLLAAGLALFVAQVLPRTWPGTTTRARLRRLMTYAAAAGAVGAVLQVPVAAVYGQGLELTDVASALDPGLVVNEVLGAVLVVVGMGLLVRTTTDSPPSRAGGALLVGAAVLALAGPSLVGHTRAFAPTPLLVAADVLHLVAGATWLGGLVGLALSLRALAGREVVAAATLARFSSLAAGVLLAVAATGTLLGWRILGSWGALVATRYGWLLLAKVGVALLVAALGGWNRWRTLPAVTRAVGFGDRERAAAAVTRTVRVEAALLVVLLAITGVLVNQSPRAASVAPVSGTTGVGTATAGDLRVLAVLDPRRTGPNTLLVQVQDAAGEPYDPPVNPVVEMRTDGLDIGTVTVTPIAAGTYRGEVVVPRAGEWEVQVSVALSPFDNPVTTLRLTVRP